MRNGPHQKTFTQIDGFYIALERQLLGDDLTLGQRALCVFMTQLTDAALHSNGSSRGENFDVQLMRDFRIRDLMQIVIMTGMDFNFSDFAPTALYSFGPAGFCPLRTTPATSPH